jgi:tetratricopeptide (TPR) repeat protein
MKNILLLIVLLFSISTTLLAQTADSDSLTREQFIHIQTAKSDSLNQLALKLAVPGAGSKDLNDAIDYIMKGLHVYSKYRDSIGLRETFDHLGLVYHLQKKYVQAKWFIIQSNSLSRELNDTLNIIHSLVNLASVKTDIKDYPMAQRDLKEALELAKSKPGIDLQIEVQKGYSEFYTQKGDIKMDSLALNRIIFLKDSVLKLDESRKLALLKQQQAAQQLELTQKQTLLKEQLRLQSLFEQKNRITIVSVSIISVLIVLCFFLYRKRKSRRLKDLK